MTAHLILYVGRSRTLLHSLRRALGDCIVVREEGPAARRLLQTDIPYSVLLFDLSFAPLAAFARSLPHRRRTPAIQLPAGDSRAVAAEIRRLLDAAHPAEPGHKTGGGPA